MSLDRRGPAHHRIFSVITTQVYLIMYLLMFVAAYDAIREAMAEPKAPLPPRYATRQ